MVADNPDEIHGSALACAALLAGEGREAVLSMVTRDRNRIALESDALGAAALGIGGDPLPQRQPSVSGRLPAGGRAPTTSTPSSSTQAREGSGSGRAWLVGAVAHPYQQPLELNLLRLKKKIAAGADFLLTQPVFDLAGFTAWMDAVRAAGLDKQVAIIASVLPLDQRRAGRVPAAAADVRAARRGRRWPGWPSASDPAKEGLAMAVEVAAQLKTIPGVRGIHILSGGCEALAGQVIEAAGLA